MPSLYRVRSSVEERPDFGSIGVYGFVTAKTITIIMPVSYTRTKIQHR